MVRKRIRGAVVLFGLLLFLVSVSVPLLAAERLLAAELPAAAKPAAAAEDIVFRARQLTEFLAAGQSEDALAMMDEAMRAALAAGIDSLWGQISFLAGEFDGIGAVSVRRVGAYDVVEMTLLFSRMKMVQTTSFDGEGLVAGLFIKPGEVVSAEPALLPDGVSEEAVTVDAGAGWPLAGLLTIPDGDVLAGVVLVHGSGPSNRDEAVGANAPFRDLAYGLAGRKMAVLRYDKRTFTYGARLQAGADIARLTVDEETVDDARAALALLRSRPELEGKPVFLVGHSMGAMLAGYIGSEGEPPAGYVLLAGSPRRLWELAAEQNLAVADEFERNGREEEAGQIRRFVAAELEKAAALAGLDDEAAAAAENAVFGLGENAWYLRHFEQIDAAALHLNDQKPLLVVQGGRDRQVTEKDFRLWQERLAAHPDAEFRFYPALNHLFGAFDGDEPPLTDLVAVEYARRTPFAEDVIDDIAAWLAEKAGQNGN